MDKKTSNNQDVEIRKGPWTMEEDLLLINYITNHGEGVWNTLARSAGLKRTGKSCRLRWLNYLRPDVRRGNITPEEQMLIMELHSRWGNRVTRRVVVSILRWSKIARHLPGRTDNEIKNYWRTRIQKQIKQGKHDDIQKYNSGPDDAGTSHSCHTNDAPPETYSPMCLEANHPEAFQLSSTMSTESSDGFWSMEDLWSNE